MRQCFFLLLGILLTSLILSASAVPAKDHKKKLLEKLRNALNQTELELEANNNPAIEVTIELGGGEEESPEAKSVGSTSEEEEKQAPNAAPADKLVEEEENQNQPDLDEKKDKEEGEKVEAVVTDLQKGDGPTSYLRKNLVRMKTILKRIFDLFGFRQSKKKEGRQNRMLTGDDAYTYNGLEYDYFQDDIRTTVGAVLGEKECIQKIVCGAGTYLRTVNGKNVILTVLENVTPTAWMDTMELLKKSAITDGDCSYKCLEADEN